ncbi:nickel pincer cofactor biosynthesis protein LarB [Granulosicoccus antarcticus]|uniref:N5-carboxyaminoimidazole ribonucleotide mutase n=1 Tax=Granulosicoccus antarcticus IMCC3135 TaxID=1192854 RepID=A0A2Z2NJ24_9GAMM|nr:nickel pincer cofactor biosynthesis protein LarB [Granulosicoccus antarcticus]ASJ71356.1 N5-carboxyaminoimidazole ribonucleotide mutase [Granulosicoccus antarcticus IMCC3135]
MSDDVRFDWQRKTRTGVPEVVLAQNKTVEQLVGIAQQCIERKHRVFMTRVSPDKAAAMAGLIPQHIQFHAESGTVYIGEIPIGVDLIDVGDPNSEPDTDAVSVVPRTRIAIVAAGTSDVPVVAEIEQTLLYLGERSTRYVDVGVAGLWRLCDLADELSSYPLLIAVAGMEGALFSVLAGLVPSPVIAVPVSVGYGVGEGGHVALNSALSSCVPGIAVVNIDNGFGAAALAVKMLGSAR